MIENNRSISPLTAGGRLRAAVEAEKPLQIVGCVNAYTARLAERVGFKALYLSGGGVCAASLGLPDLGFLTLDEVLTDARRICDRTELPLLVDVDTGFGSAFQIARTVKSLIRVGAAGMHIEDQVSAKRCGHLPQKAVVPLAEMVDRIKAAVDGRTDASFVIIARTDALAVEGLDSALERACACVKAGADMIFPEAMTSLSMYKRFAEATKVPVLANMTEFGVTPLCHLDELRKAGVSLALYPLSAFRAMNAAALKVYETLRREGTQEGVIRLMQTRAELYDFLDYRNWEEKYARLFPLSEKGSRKS
ncbi:MAG: methylisocitrate lyase [Terriglobia bacterium]